jgi:hypothetical protein
MRSPTGIRVAFWLASLLVTVVTSRAQGDALPPAVVVIPDGTPAPSTLATIEQVVSTRMTFTDHTDFLVALKALRVPVIGLPPGEQALDAIRHVAREQDVAAVVVVRVSATPRGRQVAVEVIDAKRGSFYAVHRLRLPPRPSPADKTKFDALLDDLDTFLPPAPTPAVAGKPPETPAPAPPSPPPPPPAAPEPQPNAPGLRGDGAAYARVVAELDFDGGGRQFAYNDGLTKNLRSYSLGLAPGAAFWFEAYPFGGVAPPLLDLAVVGDVRGNSAPSEATGTAVIASTWIRFDAGLRYRVQVGSSSHPVVFAASAQYAREAFTFSPEGSNYPAAIYSCMSLGLDGRVPIGASGITWSAAYLPVLSSASENTNFRGTTAEGVEVSLGVAVHLTRGFELQARGIYTRFFLSYDPQPGDAYVAGGALDQLFHGELGIKAYY